MSVEFVSPHYATVDDFMDALGMSESDQANISEPIRDRFALWVTEGNNNVEGEISKLSDDTSLVEGTDAFVFAKNAVFNWAMYKQRSMLGSANKKDAFEDYNRTIENLRNVLIKTRGKRTITASVLGKSPKDGRILLPSQIDTQFYD